MTPPRTGIHGIGAVTGYGWGRERLWNGLVGGEPAGGWVAGHGPGGSLGWVIHVPEGGDPADGRSRFARALRASVREAVTDARERGWRPGARVGLVHAVVLGEVDLWRAFYLEHGGRRPVREYLALMPSTPVSELMQEFGFHGPAISVSAMCASGNAAMITAKGWLDTGVADDVIVVATDVSCTPENTAHFVALGVAVTDAPPLDACRPFQSGSRGFVMGEASAAFVLSARPGAAYADLLGGAMSHDAYHATSIDPGLDEVYRCFTAALDAAGILAEQVGYLHAHGPGTAQCDATEAAMLEKLFARDTQVYSIKPLVGHCQGAASAVEIAVTALGYQRGGIPAPRAVSDPHPQLLSGYQRTDPLITLKSSLGMGGHNSAVLLASPDDPALR